MNRVFSVIFSAFFLILAYVYPCISMLTIMLSMALIFYMRIQYQLAVGFGFLWGFIVFGIHLSWIYPICCMYFGNVYGLTAWLILIAWFSMSVAVWWAMLGLDFWFDVAITVLFFKWISDWSLILIGRLEGYPLFWPEIVLPYFLFNVLFVCILIFARMLVTCMVLRQYKAITISMICFVVVCFVCQTYKHSDNHIKNMNTLIICPHKISNPMAAGYRILDQLSPCMLSKQKCTILMPESAFPFNIDEYISFVDIWSEGIDEILLGTHYKNNTVMCVLKNGLITHMYVKKHLMPLVETGLCFSQRSDTLICNGDIISINNNRYQVFLCSEFFFQSKKITENKLLLLYNDEWLLFDWIKNLAVSCINYVAQYENIKILFIARSGRTNGL